MIRETIIQIIDEKKTISAPVTENMNLYQDLGFDSLSFMFLLTKIEHTFSVTFSIMEMETCLHVQRLIDLVEQKVKECGNK